MLRASGATMADLAAVLGIRGEITMPEITMAMDCPRKFAGKMFIICSAMRLSRPDWEAATPIHSAPNSSHQVEPLKVINAVESGTAPVTTQATHIAVVAR